MATTTSVAPDASVHSPKLALDEPQRLRIVSWNVGLKGLEATFSCIGSIASVLVDTGVDILALQETKHSSGSVRAENAVVRGWGTFMCGNREGRAGYSGVLLAVRDSLPVISVQHGLTGALASGARAPGGPSSALTAPLAVSEEDLPPVATPPLPVPDLALDGEGRAISVDLGFAVILCVYCPAATTEKADRVAEVAAFKARFHAAVAARARALRRAGRRVIIVGDLNVSHGPLDHMDARDWERRHGAPFASAPYRRWMSSLVGAEAAMRAAAETYSASARPSAAIGREGALVLATATASSTGATALMPACVRTSSSGSHVLLPVCCVCGAPSASSSSAGASAAAEDAGIDLEHASRAWIAPPVGCSHFNDSFRRYWPHRERAYTCWHVAAGCRATNYGTRLDYALVSADVPLVAAGDEALRQLQRPSRDGSVAASSGTFAAGAGPSSALTATVMHTRAESELPALAAAPLADSSGAGAGAGIGKPAAASGVHPAFPPKAGDITAIEAALARRYGVIVTGADIAPGYAAQHSDHCPIVLDLMVSGEALAAARALAPQLASAHPSTANATQFAHKQASLRQLWTSSAAAATRSVSAGASAGFSSAAADMRRQPSSSASSANYTKGSGPAVTAAEAAVKSVAPASSSDGADCDVITIDDDDDALPTAAGGKSRDTVLAGATSTGLTKPTGATRFASGSGTGWSIGTGSGTGWSIGGLAASLKAAKSRPKAASAVSAASGSSQTAAAGAGSSTSSSSSSVSSKSSSLLGKRPQPGSLTAFARAANGASAGAGHVAQVSGCASSVSGLSLDAEAVVDVEASPAFSTGDAAGCGTATAAAAAVAAPEPPPAKRRHTEADTRMEASTLAAAPGSAISAVASGSASASAGGSSNGLRLAILTPEAPPPKCACGEVTVRRRAKASGREFFACKRPEGAPGTPGARCNYFKWAADWQEEQRQAMLQRRQAAAAATATVAAPK